MEKYVHIGRNFDGSMVRMPIKIIEGKKPGPTLFLSGALHGDELCGPAIIQKIINHKSLYKLKGRLIAVPVVNVFGFNEKSRYLPQRKDLNRFFPGSKNGSLASQLARIFTNEVIKKSDYGIDFHSAGKHKVNIPQIRIGDQSLLSLAKTFNAPLTLDSAFITGSMRETAHNLGVKVLLFEGDECLHVDEKVTNEAVDGTLSVMFELGMIPNAPNRSGDDTFHARSSYWVRSPAGGILNNQKKLGSILKKNELIAIVTDLFGDEIGEIRCPTDGMLLGMTKIPLTNKGDAVFHIATIHDFDDLEGVEDDLIEFEHL